MLNWVLKSHVFHFYIIDSYLGNHNLNANLLIYKAYLEKEWQHYKTDQGGDNFYQTCQRYKTYAQIEKEYVEQMERCKLNPKASECDQCRHQGALCTSDSQCCDKNNCCKPSQLHSQEWRICLPKDKKKPSLGCLGKTNYSSIVKCAKEKACHPEVKPCCKPLKCHFSPKKSSVQLGFNAFMCRACAKIGEVCAVTSPGGYRTVETGTCCNNALCVGNKKDGYKCIKCMNQQGVCTKNSECCEGLCCRARNVLQPKSEKACYPRPKYDSKGKKLVECPK